MVRIVFHEDNSVVKKNIPHLGDGVQEKGYWSGRELSDQSGFIPLRPEPYAISFW